MTTYASPEDAYWAFFETFNKKDADAWADVMSYPHVRLSPFRESRIYSRASDYSAAASWERIEATGWVRTQGIEPERVHESDEGVHLGGGWTRFDAHGARIRENRVVYVMTRLGESWGIQARFGVDSYSADQEVRAAAEAALDSAERYLQARCAGDYIACAELCHFAMIEVQPGEVRRWTGASEYAERCAETAARLRAGAELTVVQVGASGANLALEGTTEEGKSEQAIVLVAYRDGRWGIRGQSVIRR